MIENEPDKDIYFLFQDRGITKKHWFKSLPANLFRQQLSLVCALAKISNAWETESGFYLWLGIRKYKKDENVRKALST